MLPFRAKYVSICYYEYYEYMFYFAARLAIFVHTGFGGQIFYYWSKATLLYLSVSTFSRNVHYAEHFCAFIWLNKLLNSAKSSHIHWGIQKWICMLCKCPRLPVTKWKIELISFWIDIDFFFVINLRMSLTNLPKIWLRVNSHSRPFRPIAFRLEGIFIRSIVHHKHCIVFHY